MAYGAVQVLHGIDLEIRRGEVCAIVGPNGAGKTTLWRSSRATGSAAAGAVSVLGVDPGRPTRAWRARIGIVLQSCEMPADLTVWSSSSGSPDTTRDPGRSPRRWNWSGSATAATRAREHCPAASSAASTSPWRWSATPSCSSSTNRPRALIPSARHQAWSVIPRLRELGKTILLTTHYMEEAEALADRVVVVVAGRIVAEGTPDTLGGRDLAPATVRFRLPAGVDPTSCRSSSGGRFRADREPVALADADQSDLGELLDWAESADSSSRL